MKRIVCLFAVMMMTVAMMAADYVTAKFTVNPQMTCENCENKIKSNIRYEKGVKQIETSLAHQLVTIKYDAAKTNPEKIIEAFKKIGYTATVSNGAQKSVCAEKTECAAAKKICCGQKNGCDGKKSCKGKKGCGEKKHCGEKKQCPSKK